MIARVNMCRGHPADFEGQGVDQHIRWVIAASVHAEAAADAKDPARKDQEWQICIEALQHTGIPV
ncbi:MAG: hypothetical protein ACYTEZ_07625 [Planctomycetota bacterium]